MRQREILPTVRNVKVELDEMADHGITVEFTVKPGGVIHCGACDSEQRANDAEILDVRRLEGQSDPADMSAVVALRCAKCKARGSIVLTYGPQASENDADVLQLLDDHSWREHTSAESKTTKQGPQTFKPAVDQQ